MEYEILRYKAKKIISKLYHKDYFYGSKNYGESIYAYGGAELSVSRERTFYKDIMTFVISTADFVVEYKTGNHDGYSRKKYEDLNAIGDLESLDRFIILLTLAS